MEVQILSPRLGETRKAIFLESNGLLYKPISEDVDKTQISDSDTKPWSGHLFCMFVMFGIASLTPWNMFITATSYFESKFNGSTPAIEENFQNYFQTGAICTDVCISFLTVPLVRYIKIPKLIYFANSVMLSMFVLTAVLAKVDSTLWAKDFFLLTEVCFCMMCGGGAMFISTMWAITSSMNTIYTEAFLIGMTFAGIIASVLNIVTLSIPGIDFVEAGFWYFVTAAVILLVSLVLFSQFHCHHYQESYQEVDAKSPVSPDLESTESKTERTPMFQLIKDTFTQGYCCFSVLYITFIMFPAVLSTLQSTADPSSTWAIRYFLPVVLFLVFNMGDLLGRLFARVVEFPGRRVIPWYTTARLVFVFLMIMCNLQPRSQDVAVWFQDDITPSILVLLFAATSGQILTLCLRYASEIGSSSADKATIGTIMGVHGALGRVLGSLSTYLVFLVIK